MFIQEANKGSNQIWRYIVGIIIVVAAIIIGQIPLTLFATLAQSQDSNLRLEDAQDLYGIGLSDNAMLLLMLIPFLFGFLSLLLVSTKVHLRPFKTLLTSYVHFRWKRFFVVVLIWLLFLFISEYISYISAPENYILIFNLKQFIPLLIIAFTLIPFQAGLEEVFFRGYLMQGIGILARSRLIPLLITSLVFGLLHYANPEVEKFGSGIMMLYYCSFGLFLGIVTLMDEGLEIALAIHIVNNIYGSTFVTFDGSALRTPAAFKVLEIDPHLMIYLWLGTAIVLLFIFDRLFHWGSWKKLVQRI